MQTKGEPKILVIDDDDDSLLLVTRMLRRNGFRGVTLNDSTRAMKVVEDEQPDLVLLDLVMPKVCGTEVLESLRKKYSTMELPVVMLTGMDDSSHVANCLRLGANDYLSKPLDSVVAVARISTQLKVARLYRENLDKKELETLNAMIVTYNHEINNPLAAAMLCLPADVSKMSQERLDTARNAVKRISSIVKKIDHVTERAIRKEPYSDSSDMIRL